MTQRQILPGLLAKPDCVECKGTGWCKGFSAPDEVHEFPCPECFPNTPEYLDYLREKRQVEAVCPQVPAE